VRKIDRSVQHADCANSGAGRRVNLSHPGGAENGQFAVKAAAELVQSLAEVWRIQELPKVED
jgi:hypothetical protein